MKNIKQQIEKEISEDSILEISNNVKPKQPKQGLSDKKHCICHDCDIFGCEEKCSVCLEIFEKSF